MKRIAAIAGTLALAAWLVSCTDIPTEPGSSSTQKLGGPSYSIVPSGLTLYAGTSQPGRVYLFDNGSWTQVGGDLGWAVLDIIEFRDQLYAVSMDNQSGVPSKAWRLDGTSWTEIQAFTREADDLEVWGDKLYAGIGNSYGPHLWVYNGATAFDPVGTVPNVSYQWNGIRAMYPRPSNLHFGDFQFDAFGHYDGTSLVHDAFYGGSCVFDIAEFNGDLYAAAEYGRLFWSSTGIGDSWSSAYPHGPDRIWELETFQGYLYSGDDNGDLIRMNAGLSPTSVWSSGVPSNEAITAMTVGGDLLLFGTGKEAGYLRTYARGTARVYAYDGTSVEKIFDEASSVVPPPFGFAGIQVLYVAASDNEAPVADPGGPYLGAAGTYIAFDGNGSSDPDGDGLTYRWDFGDGGIGSGATPSHRFDVAGMYDVCLTVNDGTADSDEACTIAVVYDPGAGFVTGGGWIESPEGAYVPDPELTGKASFGFVAKYKKGATVPDGNTEFQFKTGGLNFHSSAYDWLVVNQGGANAQFKGTGTVNGEGEYKFMIWAQDGSPDTFRIKIWQEDGGETVLYDNGFDQEISGGSIIIHTK